MLLTQALLLSLGTGSYLSDIVVTAPHKTLQIEPKKARRSRLSTEGLPGFLPLKTKTSAFELQFFLPIGISVCRGHIISRSVRD